MRTAAILDVGLRVGSPKLDNYHLLNGSAPAILGRRGRAIEGVRPAVKQLAGSNRIAPIARPLNVDQDQDQPSRSMLRRAISPTIFSPGR